MICPGCRETLTVEHGCASCDCGGVWFTLAQAQEYFELSEPEYEQSMVPPAAPSMRMCPVCHVALEHIEAGEDLTLDHCPKCKGLYFDEGESLELRSKLAMGHGGPAFRKTVSAAFLGVSPAGPYR